MAKKVGLQKSKPAPPDSSGDSIALRGGAEQPASNDAMSQPVIRAPGGTPDTGNISEGHDEMLEEDGTLASGYGESGPYHCEDCIHVRPEDSCCIHPVVVNDPALASRRIAGKDGVKIDPERGCCRYVRPPEEKKGPVSEEE